MIDAVKTQLRRLLPQNRFARSVSVLAGGTAAGQIVVVAASPVLTRLYSPDDFGLLAVYAGLLGILGVITSLRYQLAIPLPESDEEAASIAVLSLLIVLGMTVLSAVLVGLFGTSIVAVLNTPALGPYLWLLPLGLLLMGVYQVFQFWAIRTNAFPVIAKTKLTQAIGMVGVQLGGYALGPVALLLGRVFGQSAGIALLARSTLVNKTHKFTSTTATDIHRAAIRHRKFPLISTWTGLSSSAGANLPPVLIAALLGSGPAGIFALTHRVLSQPMAVIGKAVGDVFYRQAAKAHREGNLGREIEYIYSKLVLLALPPAGMIFIIAPQLFVLTFGAEWAEAGRVARWIVPWMFFQFVVSPPTRVYPILDKHGIALRFQVGALFSGIISAFVGGYLYKSLLITIILMSLFNSGIYLVRLMTTYNLVGKNWVSPLKNLFIAIPWAVACNLPLIFVWFFTGDLDLSNVFDLIMLIFTTFAVILYSSHQTNIIPPTQKGRGNREENQIRD